MKVHIDIKTKQLAPLGEKAIEYFMKASSEELTSDIKKETPVDHGNLRGAWIPKLSKDKLIVSNSTNYALFVEKGTGMFDPRGSHLIYPKTKKVMKANIDGEDVFFAYHRGRPAKKMAEKGAKNFRATKLNKLLKLSVQKTMQK